MTLFCQLGVFELQSSKLVVGCCKDTILALFFVPFITLLLAVHCLTRKLITIKKEERNDVQPQFLNIIKSSTAMANPNDVVGFV